MPPKVRDTISEAPGDFCVEISFERGSGDPTRVFRSLSSLIATFQRLDEDLARVIDARIEPRIVLEEIESGSIRTWLRNVVETVGEEDLAELNWKGIVGKYLVRARRAILEFLNKRETISNHSELEELEDDLSALARETNVAPIASYGDMPRRKLVKSICDIGGAVSALSKDDTASYIADNKRTRINPNFTLSAEQAEALVTEEIIRNRVELILKVKKPDYLGTSRWEFRFEDHIIEVSITDKEWLSQFQARGITVRPGDSIRGLVDVSISYDEHRNVSGKHYELVRVIDVLFADSQQLGFPLSNDE